MTPCPKPDDLLAMLLAEGALSDEVRRHVEQCPRCTQEMASLREIVDVLGSAGGARMPAAWTEEVLARIDASGPWARTRRVLDLVRPTLPTFALATVSAFMLLLTPLRPSGLVSPDPLSLLIWAVACGLLAMAWDVARLRRRAKGSRTSP